MPESQTSGVRALQSSLLSLAGGKYSGHLSGDEKLIGGFYGWTCS